MSDDEYIKLLNRCTELRSIGKSVYCIEYHRRRQTKTSYQESLACATSQLRKISSKRKLHPEIAREN